MNAMNLPGYATQFMYRKISSLHSVASALANCCALGAFHSNTVILDYPSHAALAGAAEQILYQYHMHRVCIRQCNLIMVKGQFQLVIKSLSSQCMIDVWWIIDSGDTLLLLAHILKRNGPWQRAAIRLFVVIESSDDGQRVEHDIKRWLSFNHLILHSIHILYMDLSYIREYTFLRELKIRQRFREPPKESLSARLMKIFGLSNGSLLQSAVDRGYRPQEGDTTSSSYSLRPVTVGTTSRAEQLHRAQHLNKVVLERSRESFVVLLNIPEPPAQLERFWVYLTYLDKLTEGLNRVLLVRGRAGGSGIFNNTTNDSRLLSSTTLFKC
uniref:Sodium/chloride cotransporter 3 n=1 Tax=Ascaris suum TaxID=6253 RepID=F1KXG4_ASCSU